VTGAGDPFGTVLAIDVGPRDRGESLRGPPVLIGMATHAPFPSNRWWLVTRPGIPWNSRYTRPAVGHTEHRIARLAGPVASHMESIAALVVKR
jgi:hypothetical protein